MEQLILSQLMELGAELPGSIAGPACCSLEVIDGCRLSLGLQDLTQELVGSYCLLGGDLLGPADQSWLRLPLRDNGGDTGVALTIDGIDAA
jgi:hypothetical protein